MLLQDCSEFRYLLLGGHKTKIRIKGSSDAFLSKISRRNDLNLDSTNHSWFSKGVVLQGNIAVPHF